jgi:hypothetical protein
MEDHRRPGAVPDLVGGADTDGDGVPDTVLSADGTDLLVRTDLDLDGFVDRVLRIGVDGVVHAEPPTEPVVGSAPAEWPGLLGRLFGDDP